LLGSVKQFQGSTIVKTIGRASSFLGLQRLAQRATHIPPLGETESNARHPSESIFPPLPTRVSDHLESLVPWFGDSIPDSSTALVILLTKGRIATNLKKLFFEAIYEGIIYDHY
jgi:hypothetical protein